MDKLFITGAFSAGGLFSKKLPQFETRKEQEKLSEHIFDALDQKKVALLEAGTGVGKSFAYLLPALYYAHVQKKKVAISTHTIALQQQLITKDFPTLLKVLGWDLKVSLVRGMSNYFCKARGAALHTRMDEELLQWSETSLSGTRQSLPKGVSKASWDEVAMDPDNCTRRRCPHYKECFFYNDRKVAEESQLLVFNHHLLLCDLQQKASDDMNFLPDYDVVIVDEAHHFEEVARQVLSKKTPKRDFYKRFNQLLSEGETSRLNVLKKELQSNDQDVLAQKILLEMFSYRLSIFNQVTTLYDALEELLSLKQTLRVVNTQGEFFKDLLQKAKNLLVEIKSLQATFLSIDQDINALDENPLVDKTFNIRKEIKNLFSKLLAHANHLDEFMGEGKEGGIKWLLAEPIKDNITVITSPLDVADQLQQNLFNEIPSVIMTSATLANGSSFSFMKKRLGINKESIEAVYTSPFNWKKQALFLAPKELDDPTSPNFFDQSIEKIKKAIQYSNGHALILFTSYLSLTAVYNTLSEQTKGYTLLRQGEDSRKNLIKKFKSVKKPILLGTDSFWEGIDLIGPVLRLVVLYKLPFKVPSHPITEAILESYKENAFIGYQIPHALIKFKQGFGRLIRHCTDRGVVICLDSRLTKKNYGKKFFNTIPDCRKEICDDKEYEELLGTFWKGADKKKWSVAGSNR